MAGQEAIWHVIIGGKEQGPLTKAHVLEYLRHGMLAGSDLIWRPGSKRRYELQFSHQP
jgi:hypothetical protein